MLSSFDVSADASLPLTASAAILACAVVLALICLRCRDDGSPGARDDVSIREASNTDESAHFRLVRQPLLLRIAAVGAAEDPTWTPQRAKVTIATRTPTMDFPESSTGDYLIVLPEGEAPGTDRSGASTPSSGEPHDYENVRERTQHSPTGCRTRTLTDRLTVCLTVLLNGLCSSDDRDYLNVIPLPQGGETPSSSSSSQNDDDDSDDSDGEGKYVNEASVSTVKFCKLSVQTSRQSHAASIS
ncbi:uncharacterized protein LOC133466414 isoform X8 [Phyllopteryx taeniolatus]|uniref:uncharacterized protein LOC133466414 isoform X8 n=1 Tax=Phyllopteryx taeniolatus TaxID=161469 RepID=UPI002AD44AFF|nr:uncharacterized protein LOC133466414 isoform X8 [Phyllopteryx taeniolatus]